VNALELTPNEKKNFDRVELFVDKDKMEVYAISLYDQNGSTYTYKIVTFIPDAPINEADFVFNESNFPDFDVIDMR
jgi:outer membrane lipoprotein-sorting protein